MTSHIRHGVLALAFAALAACAPALPQVFTLTGTLTDPLGNATNAVGLLWQVDFFETETSEQILATAKGSSTGGGFISESLWIGPPLDIVEGRWVVRVGIPDTLLKFDEVWYRVALDTDRDGIDGEDYFDGRFQITAVPFAMSARPVGFFNTHGGSGAPGTIALGVGPNALRLSPFTTPPGGVEFNRFAFSLASITHGVIVSVAIYDDAGDRVAWTQPFVPEAQGTYVFPIAGKLLPSRVYYVGYTASANIALTPIGKPDYPGLGSSVLSTQGGTVPAQIALEDLAMTSFPMSTTLVLVDEERATATAGLSPASGVSAEGIPTFKPVPFAP